MDLTFATSWAPALNEGARGLEDASQAGTLFFWLEKMGMSRRERELVARENFLRVLA